MKTASQTAREIGRTESQHRIKMPAGSNPSIRTIQNATRESEDAIASRNSLWRTFGEVWADIVTGLSIAVCVWFLAEMVYQVLHE
jgi:hypothetical protein